MTKRRVTVSVPEDVAETLEQQPKGQASAYVTEAVRGHRAWEQFRAEQARRGVPLTEQGMTEARARRYDLRSQWPAERYEALRERVRRHVEDGQADQQAPAA
ncbi:hypothetical protein ACNAW0_15285 [Micromonospora sp. SL1-18]|uniref:hypothetical protein n=1 Tax=Micromonospora sp. SL1-18 TaxID=3399128 RepID=UPI003A4DBACB